MFEAEPVEARLPMTEKNESAEFLWKQYELSVGLVKSYLELVLKLNLFFYAITGAILSYYLAHMHEDTALRWSLVLPIIMGLAFGLFYSYGAVLSANLRNEIRTLRNEIFPLHARRGRVFPEGRVLTVFLWISAAMLLIVAIGLIALVVRHH